MPGKKASELVKQSPRSPVEVDMAILMELSSERKGPTEIMMGAGICWKVAQKHLAHLLERRFIQVYPHRTRKKYSLTEDGITMLGRWQDMISRLYLDKREVFV